MQSAALARDTMPFAPRGARECSHGWSAARAQPRQRNPWSAGCADFSAPAGAAEAHASRCMHETIATAPLHFDRFLRPYRGELN